MLRLLFIGLHARVLLLSGAHPHLCHGMIGYCGGVVRGRGVQLDPAQESQQTTRRSEIGRQGQSTASIVNKHSRIAVLCCAVLCCAGRRRDGSGGYHHCLWVR